jgi:hypothetical protein
MSSNEPVSSSENRTYDFPPFLAVLVFGLAFPLVLELACGLVLFPALPVILPFAMHNLFSLSLLGRSLRRFHKWRHS